MSGKQLYFSKQTQGLTYAGAGGGGLSVLACVQRSAGSRVAHGEGGPAAVLLLSGEAWLRGGWRALVLVLARVGTSGERVQGRVGERGCCQEHASQSLRASGAWAIVPCGARRLLAWPRHLWTHDCFRGRDVLDSNGWCRPGGWSLCSRGLLGYWSGGFKGLELCTSIYSRLSASTPLPPSVCRVPFPVLVALLHFLALGGNAC